MSLSNALLARFQNEPTMVEPSHQGWFEACIHMADTEMARVQGLAQAAKENMSTDDENWWGAEGSWQSYLRPYVVRDGILQIPVKGVLLNDFPYALGSWATGYDYIWKCFQRGLSDENVKGFALIIDSPGGMVAGNFDLVDKMFEARGTKPCWAFAHESAYSAAYSIASVADGITVSRTGGVGSIGVVTSHVDVSAAMSQNGYKITFIYAGEHKVDGNPYEALPAKVKARIQERIDALYDVFVQTVARNRNMDEQAVRDTKAQTFMPSEALSNGLADKIGTLDDSLADYSASLNLNEGDDAMADFTQAQLDEAVATATANATATATVAGAAAAKDRITAILACDNAKNRPAAALAAAIDTDMTAEQANTFLSKLAVETTPEASTEQTPAGAGAPTGMFKAAMKSSDNPDIKAGDDDEKSEMSVVDNIFGSIGREHSKAA